MNPEPALPLYRNLSQVDPPLTPPFGVDRLLSVYFPLDADLERLRRLCDEYLNFRSPQFSSPLPDEIGRFVPFLPYVFLTFLVYPQVESVTGNIGSFSQRELTFGFPVEWRRKRNGRWRSEGSVFFYPLIYLDSSLGLTTGREVHGWPKEMATFDTSIGSPRDLASGQPCSCRMSTAVADRSAQGARYAPSILLELVPRAAPSPLGLVANWERLADSAFAGWSGVAQGVAKEILSDPADAGVMQLDRWRSLIPAMRMRRVVTLKQFRDSAAPDAASYQALILSALQVRSLGGFGLVGSNRIYTGDSSGGHEIRIHHHDSHPIVDLLGLRVEKQAAQEGVFTALPRFPFWFEMDLEYRTESVLCERTTARAWGVRDGARIAATGSGPNAYNEGRRPFQECAPGPFELKDAVLRILRLKADSTVIKRICEAHSLPGGDLVCPVATDPASVYLILASGEQRSLSKPGHAWTFSSLGLYVPVDHPAGRAFVAPLELVDHPMSAIAGREAEGRNIWLAEFDGEWLQTPEPKTAAHLLNVRSPV